MVSIHTLAWLHPFTITFFGLKNLVFGSGDCAVIFKVVLSKVLRLVCTHDVSVNCTFVLPSPHVVLDSCSHDAT